MKITAQDLLRFGVIDRIVKEPLGGAHRDVDAVIASSGDAIAAALADLAGMDAQAPAGASRPKISRHRAEIVTLHAALTTFEASPPLAVTLR